ncbi:MAG: hypothetical protein GMKNLPBB_00383 [Myxococcota bacterium]|nr:hypothetical protein [Myxococcota bacterium]
MTKILRQSSNPVAGKMTAFKQVSGLFVSILWLSGCGTADSPKQRGEECNPANPNCVTNLICAGIQGGVSVCTTTCDPAFPNCFQNEICMAVPDGRNLCIVKERPKPLPKAALGNPCGPTTAECDSGLVCTGDVAGAATGTCRKICAPGANPSGCAGNEACRTINATQGACYPVTQAAIGEECDSISRICKSDALCIREKPDSTAGQCYAKCQGKQDPNCNPAAGFLCKELSNNTFGCVPEDFGAQKRYEACEAGANSKLFCAPKLVCIRSRGSVKRGNCLGVCNPLDDIPDNKECLPDEICGPLEVPPDAPPEYPRGACYKEDRNLDAGPLELPSAPDVDFGDEDAGGGGAETPATGG